MKKGKKEKDPIKFLEANKRDIEHIFQTPPRKNRDASPPQPPPVEAKLTAKERAEQNLQELASHLQASDFDDTDSSCPATDLENFMGTAKAKENEQETSSEEEEEEDGEGEEEESEEEEGDDKDDEQESEEDDEQSSEDAEESDEEDDDEESEEEMKEVHVRMERQKAMTLQRKMAMWMQRPMPLSPWLMSRRSR